MLATVCIKLRNKLLSKKTREAWNLRPAIRPEVLVSDRHDLCATAPPRGELAYPEATTPANPRRLVSSLCTAADMRTPAMRYWYSQLGEHWVLHRKLWEYGYICQALYERGYLAPGKRGLGFAVGREPLPSLFAALGCEIVATDLAASDNRAAKWGQTNQWTEHIADLNARRLCPDDEFARRVDFRPVDMNFIPADLVDFDFTWSSCSFEHCGNLRLGADFVVNQARCLRPGGVAVHTTEFNLSSNTETQTSGNTVVFRRRDLEEICDRLHKIGCDVEPLNLWPGDEEADRWVDLPPFDQKLHLRLVIGKWASTSIGLIITKR